jgi:hypothetical protein
LLANFALAPIALWFDRVVLATAPPRLLPVGPMARRLRVPVGWLRAEAEAGRVPCLRAGRVLLFEPETVEGVLVERARQGGHDHGA